MLEAPFDLNVQIQQGELDSAAIRAATTALSLALIPGTSQLNRSLNYLLAYEEGTEETFDISEFLLTGPVDDE